MDREQINKDLDRATKTGLIKRDYIRHHFTLRKDYVYIHVSIDCNEYKWGSGITFSAFSTTIKIPTPEYSYRRLANAIRKAKKEHEELHG